MEQHLVQIANAFPESVAVIDEDRQVSYRELFTKADALVQILCKQDFKNEEPVCTFLPPGLDQITGQIAVLRAGGTCVPIEPSMPQKRVVGMLRDIDSRYVITSRERAAQFTDFCVLPIEDMVEQKLCQDKHGEIPLLAGCPESHRTHVFFTSGSTGKPKPIQVLACGIIHAIKHFPGPALGPSDRTTTSINPGFDFSLFEILMPLFCGAATVKTPKAIVTDPLALKGFLDKHMVTAMIVPAAIFNVVAHIAPTTFSGRRHVVVGGEAVNPTAMRKVLASSPPERLWNGYGPTETTIYVTMCLVDLEESQRSHVSIGRPVGHTKVHLLDDQRRPITAANEPGEICVSGPQLSPGYFRLPEETEKQFIFVDGATLGQEPGVSVRLYRTGDLGQWRDDTGLLDYIGRRDNQIKRFGHRVELGDIERTVETHPQVFACVVSQRHRGTSDKLVAYVIPENWDHGFEETAILMWVNERLPSYMVPGLIEKRRNFPTSANSKVDRKALAADEHDHADREVSPKPVPVVEGTKTRWLQTTLQEYLGVSCVKANDDIFSLGLSSLQAARLIGDIKQHSGNSVTMGQLHANASFRELAALLDTSNKVVDVPSQMLKWEEDSHMADDIAAPAHWQSPSEGRVFLTGATGFLGAHLLHYLLSLPSVKQVACLARRRGKMTATARVQQALGKYGLWNGKLEKLQKILILDGELAHDYLGIGKDKFHWLADWASVVFHVGARVNWCEPYEAHYGPNVIGTRNIIQLAVHGRRKALHYVSSIDAWNVSGFVSKTDRVFEDEPLRPYLGSLPYDAGYAQSQWVVDEMVQRARARGLPAVIYRPGFVLGDQARAIGNPGDFFGRLVVGCIQTGYFPYLPRQSLEWVTVDYVCSALLHIASKTENLGRSYHLVSPDPTQSVTMEGTCRLINEAGYPVKQIPYHDWVARIRASPGNALEPMMPVLQEEALGDNTRIQNGTYNPIYDARNTIRALEDRPDIRYRPLDAPLLRRFVEIWVERGDYRLDG